MLLSFLRFFIREVTQILCLEHIGLYIGSVRSKIIEAEDGREVGLFKYVDISNDNDSELPCMKKRRLRVQIFMFLRCCSLSSRLDDEIVSKALEKSMMFPENLFGMYPIIQCRWGMWLFGHGQAFQALLRENSTML